jgi:tetratricopeptide (TPR) repeat protein
LFYTLAENWLYIPSAGFYIIAAPICLAIHEKLLSVSSRYFRYVCPGIVFLVTITLAGVTINQNNVWKDEISLGKNTLRFNPREFKIYNNMGVVYLSRGELDKAEEAFKKCLRIKPDTGMAYFNLYRVYKARGENKKAAENLKKAKKYDPKRVGIIMQKMGISH